MQVQEGKEITGARASFAVDDKRGVLRLACVNPAPVRTAKRAGLRVAPPESFERRLARNARLFSKRLLVVQEELRHARAV